MATMPRRWFRLGSRAGSRFAVEAGCGSAAVITEGDGQVRWSDSRDFTGVYQDPLADVLPPGGVSLRLPELVFDSGRYQAEVERAIACRW